MRTRLLALLATLGCCTAHADIPADLDLVPFASGLDNPLAVRHAGDGSGRVFVVQQDGEVLAFSAAGVLLGTVLDVGSGAPRGFTGSASHSERGLMGLAFHPDYPLDPRLFVYYTDGNGDTVVASWNLPEGSGTATAPEVLLRVDQDFANHNGGDLHFGPDGYLYISLGDGGSGGDPCGRAQTLDPADLAGNNDCAVDSAFLTATASFPGNPDSRALLGKILRVDVDGSSSTSSDACGADADGSAPYGIPPGNPFAGGGTANGCGEVWHYGLRNPYRFSFDRGGGALYIGDVGQGTWEEVDLSASGQGGLNFGWDACEGDHPIGNTAGACTLPGATAPILEYRTHVDGTCAVTGGFVYRGPVSPLVGDYVYGDYCSGEVWIASNSGAGWSNASWRDTGHFISGFGEDEDGDLYLTDLLGGTVLRFDSAEIHGIFADGFEG